MPASSLRSDHVEFLRGALPGAESCLHHQQEHRRRHLTKEEKADLIVAAHKAAMEAEKPGQGGPVSTKGGRGKKSPLKAAVVADAKKAGISERTAKRSIAKSYGRKNPN